MAASLALLKLLLVALPALAMVPSDQVQVIDAPVADVDPAELTMARAAGKSDPMMELLHWASKHSDPERLKELQKKYEESNLTIKEIYGQDVFDAMFVDEANVMKQAIQPIMDFKNTSLSDDDLEAALYQLQEMVEQVDNAGNLHGMGGLVPLLDLAVGEARGFEVRALALWTLGIAAQNNEPVQADIFNIDGLARLVSAVPRDCGEVAAAGCCEKLLFALSSLVRNHEEAQVAADSLGFFDWLLDTGVQSASLGIAKKALGLLDTVLAQSAPKLTFLEGIASQGAAGVAARRAGLAQALIARVRGAGQGEFSGQTADAADKALRLVHRLLSLRPFLFDASFRLELGTAAQAAVKACERVHGAADELCVELATLAKQADAVLAARDIPDEEL